MSSYKRLSRIPTPNYGYAEKHMEDEEDNRKVLSDETIKIIYDFLLPIKWGERDFEWEQLLALREWEEPEVSKDKYPANESSMGVAEDIINSLVSQLHNYLHPTWKYDKQRSVSLSKSEVITLIKLLDDRDNLDETEDSLLKFLLLSYRLHY